MIDSVPLSPRERQAYDLKRRGLSRASVARELGVTDNRVKNLWQSVRRKMRRMGGSLPPEPERRTVGAMSLSHAVGY